MKLALKPFAGVFVLTLFAAATPASASAQPEQIVSRMAQLDSIKLRCLTAVMARR